MPAVWFFPGAVLAGREHLNAIDLSEGHHNGVDLGKGRPGLGGFVRYGRRLRLVVSVLCLCGNDPHWTIRWPLDDEDPLSGRLPPRPNPPNPLCAPYVNATGEHLTGRLMGDARLALSARRLGGGSEV